MVFPTLHQLEIFLVIARRQSFARAAEELFLSAPSVSLQVQRLEQHYGARLFVRTSRGPTLTPAGEALREAAETIFAQLTDAATAIERTKTSGRAHLGVGATMMLGIYRLPLAIAMFRRRRPLVEVNLLVSDHDQLEEALLRQTIDLAVTGRLFRSPHLHQEPFTHEQLPLLVSSQNPLARRSSISKAMLQSQTLLMRESGSQTREAIVAAITQQGLRFDNVVETQSIEELIRGVVENRGIGFAPAAWCEIELQLGQLTAIRVVDVKIDVCFYLCYRADQQFSEEAKAFLQCCREVIQATPSAALLRAV
jgi:DNA-binding transcriptional LysR family regulator